MKPASRRNVRLLQAHALLLNMLFVIPVIVPYYRDVLGLGFREFMIGEAVFSTVVILMEVPTGWLSDVWKRRSVMIAGTLAQIAGWLMLLCADDLWSAAAAQGTIGIGVSLFSGTNSALLYDSLLESGQEQSYRQQEGFRMGIGLYSIAGASVFGGFLYAWNPYAPILAGLTATFLALGAALLMIEPARHKRAVEKHPLADMAQTVRYALHGHPEVAGIIILAAILFASTKMVMWTQQPYYILLELDEKWFGVLMACSFALGGLGGHFGHRLDGHLRNITVLLGCLAFVGTVCLVSGLWPGLYAVPLLLCACSPIFGFANPRMQDAINRRVGSERRATILSTANLMVHFVAIPLMVVMGQIEGRWGITNSLLTLAALVTAGGAAAFLLLQKSSREKVLP